MKNSNTPRAAVVVLALACANIAHAQQVPYTQPGTGQPPAPPPPPPPTAAAPAEVAPLTDAPPPEPAAIAKLFGNQLPEAVARGKFNLNARLRYEFVDQSNLPRDAHAPTIRTRFGFTTAPLHGFQGMIEGENITVIGPDHNFNAAGSNGQGNRPVVADPPTTELNQAWISYSHDDLVMAKAGRQRIVLDNHRFVGDVGWRQNMQTFDAVTAYGNPIPDLKLFYGYVWDVRRIFGDVAGLPGANRDFDSDSHLINVSWSGFKYGRVAGYTYLLDLENPAGTANSTATYGGSFAGNTPVSDRVSIGYRAEFAWQTDYADSPLDYGVEYYNVEVGANIRPVAFGIGYEVLGSASNRGPAGGRTAFRTPLATLHAFNGWADAFLATPNDGLRDLYGFIQVTLPQQIPLRFVYHKFDAASGGGDFGQEFDVMATRRFGRHWNVLVKYSFYDGKDVAPPALTVANVDIHKFWAQIEFNY
jgi:hypothetical protein